MVQIGFIGLGNMGLPMAVNLVKAGHTVKGYDPVPDALVRAEKAGLVPATDLASAVSDADAVVSMLPTGRHVLEVYTGEGGVLASAKPQGAVLIDCSTIDVAIAQKVAHTAGEQGFAMVDAPVSGGVMAAEGGTLTFMVGGPDAAFARAEPILEPMAKRIVHAGGPGMGQAAKICNNMLLGISMIGTAEAFVLAEKLGLDWQRFFDIASTASGQCWSLTSYCPVPGPVDAAPSNRDYQPGFSTAMMLKDLKLAQDAAHTSGAPTPLGAQAAALYSLLASSGMEQEDFSTVINMLRGARIGSD